MSLNPANPNEVLQVYLPDGFTALNGLGLPVATIPGPQILDVKVEVRYPKNEGLDEATIMGSPRIRRDSFWSLKAPEYTFTLQTPKLTSFTLHAPPYIEPELQTKAGMHPSNHA